MLLLNTVASFLDGFSLWWIYYYAYYEQKPQREIYLICFVLSRFFVAILAIVSGSILGFGVFRIKKLISTSCKQ